MLQPSSPRPLGPAFARLWSANVATNLGDGIAAILAPLLAVGLTDDPLLIAGVAAMTMVPWLVFAIPAGVIVDRVDRRLALAVANLVRVGFALLLVALSATGSLTIWWLYLVVFAYGVGETVADGAVRAATPGLVPRASLARANSRIEAAELIVQRFASGPLASLLFAIAAIIPLGLNAIAFAVAGLLALTLPRSARPSPNPEPWRARFSAGLRFILSDPRLRPVWLLGMFTTLCFAAAWGSYAVRVIDGLGLPEEWFGLFLLTQGVGGLLGSMLAGRIARRLGTGPTIATAAVIIPAGIALIGMPSLWFAAAGFAISSFGIMVSNIHTMSLRQSIVPPQLLGRVHGTWRTFLWGAMPVGALLGGLLGRVDLSLPFLIGGGLYLLAGALSFRMLARLPNPDDLEPKGTP